jgi:DNA repair exonuclease SbcCD ATPase subunit
MVWIFIPVVAYALFVSFVIWNLIGDYAELQEREERQSQRIVKVMEQRNHYEQLATKHAALVDELGKDLAEAKRELVYANNVNSERLARCQQDLEATKSELEDVRGELAVCNQALGQRETDLQNFEINTRSIVRAFNQIREICNT